jgi:capsule polysaccharide modification protein KpsS
MLESLIKKRVVLLQGPMGPFFRKLDNHLRKKGTITYRICFNGGDRFFANKDNRFDFTEKPDSWKAFISRFMRIKTLMPSFCTGIAGFIIVLPSRRQRVPVFTCLSSKKAMSVRILLR